MANYKDVNIDDNVVDDDSANNADNNGDQK